MTQRPKPSCCVCGVSDQRALIEVVLAGGLRATLCGSHAVMHGRERSSARSESELREQLRDRRATGERRQEGDELAAALSRAFSGERREGPRRRHAP
jgi:hypothetical protein